MEIKHRLPTVEEYLKLRALVGWRQTDMSATEKALSNSLFSVVATERDTVIGFGRIVGDGGLYFYIQDLIVHPDVQSKGVGNALMKELMDYIYTNAKPGSFIGLMAAKGLEKYYRAFGFVARDLNAPGMFLVLK
jgi:ribosomal protein S18 acetylase RimI-like enzyme